MLKESDKQLLLSKIDIVELISEYVDLKKSGAGFKGLSPFKSENTPSFMVSSSKKIFKDFSSNIGGDAIKFYMLINNLTYLEAVDELARKYNVNINITSEKRYNVKYYNLLSEISKIYQENLLASKEALEYLKNRGYSLNDIKEYRLGYALDKWDSIYVKYENDDTVKDLLELGIVSHSENRYYDTFKNRIMIPILNVKGDIIGFGGRDISSNPNVAKYLNSKESKIFKKSFELFGVFDGGKKIKEYNSCILVEGYFDVLALHKNNIKNVVASLGTALTEKQAEYIRKFTNNIVIAYDNDSAGLEAKKRAIHILNKFEFNIKVMDYSNLGKDPDEILHKYGKNDFVDILSKSKDAFDFLFEYYLKEKDISKLGTKMQVISDMKPYFSSLKNMIYYDEFVDRFSKRLNISKEALKSNLGKIAVSNNLVSTKKPKESNLKISKKARLEELTILYLLYDKTKYSLFNTFSFENIYYESIIDKGFDGSKFSEEEKEIVFHLKTKYTDISKIDYILLYKEWVLDYIKNSREMILDYYNGYENMNDEDYAKYMSFVSQVKEIEKSVDLPKIKEVYINYMEYEKGKLHATKGEENK